ncbi:MAG: DUF378 domain-containing protein [Oscillospiraceae bacterium]|nr:DUF378 domain-containing protein [Oscillospiraceae bacterium]
MLRRLILALLIAGGLNWGLVGVFSFNAVAWLCGGADIFARILFTLVGLAAAAAPFVLRTRESGDGPQAPPPDA